MKPTTPASPNRIASVDAYRGFVMFLMMAEVLSLLSVARSFRVDKDVPEKTTLEFLAVHQTHVEWSGCSLHDMIQPSFTFLVGVALPFSLASRIGRGQHKGWMIAHAAWRALVLTALGVFLRSIHKSQTYFTFEDTLSQIGLGYVPLFLLGFAKPKWQWLALGVLLLGYWAAFALYPLPGPNFDYSQTGVTPDWPHNFTGFAAHWNKNTNLAWAFDRWFLNLFPPANWFQFNGGGYATLSFLPTLGTMILGLIAGGWLKGSGTGWNKAGCLVLAGVAFAAAGYIADYLGVCPSVKRIWTPAWTLFSGGLCFLFLAGFYTVMDVMDYQTWAFPLRVIGINSIAAYCMAELHFIHDFIVSSFHTHLGPAIFKAWWDPRYEPLATGAAVLAVYWLILFWMYRRKIFLRI
jgi:heparan-alpha-glucosaminide N-acetyltransferase